MKEVSMDRHSEHTGEVTIREERTLSVQMTSKYVFKKMGSIEANQIHLAQGGVRVGGCAR